MKLKDFNEDAGQDDEDIDNIIQKQRNKLDGEGRQHQTIDPVNVQNPNRTLQGFNPKNAIDKVQKGNLLGDDND